MNPRIRYWLLFCLLWVTGWVHAQYNPANPPEPAVYVTLTLNATPANACTFNVNTPAVYEAGKTVRLKATAAANFKFVAWTEGTVVVSTVAQFDYTLPYRNVTLTAQYTYSPTSPAEPPEPNIQTPDTTSVPQQDTTTYCTLYVSCSPTEGGTINVASGNQYALGASVSLKATAKTNFKFVNWMRDGEVISSTAQFSYIIQHTENHLVANFEYTPENPTEPTATVPTYKLTLECSPAASGSINLSSGNTYPKGQVINLAATPKSSYQFVRWTSDGNILSTSATLAYVMPAHAVTIVAEFEKIYNPTNPDEPSTCLLGSGSCGANLTWTLTCDYVLTIRGTGSMNDYAISNTVVPWNDYKHLIRTVILPDEITCIGKLAFASFARLTSIRIPEQVTQIGDSAFLRCRRLEIIYSQPEVPPTWGVDAFDKVNRLIPLVVPKGKRPTYRNAAGWNEFPSMHEEPYIPSTVTVFGDDVVVIETNDTLTTVYEEVDLFDDASLIYNSIANTLTLNGLTLDAQDSLTTALSFSGSEPLTIVLNASSTIYADTVLVSTADLIITGEGTLEAEGVVPILGAATATILFDSVSMHVRSLPSPAAVRQRIKGSKHLDETGGPALSGFASVDYDKTDITPPEADYGDIEASEVPGLTESIRALYIPNPDGTKTILTEFTLTAIGASIDAVEQIRTIRPLDLQQPMYNILGMKVDATYHGIVIQNGQTYLR